MSHAGNVTGQSDMEEIARALGDGELSDLQRLRVKDGVAVYRVRHCGRSLVAKCYHDDASRREILNYALLSSLDIPTLEMLGSGERCLCLEDLARSDRLRLGTEDDLSDPAVARSLATWYRDLHDRGAGIPELSALYSESDLLTHANLGMLAERYPAAAATWEFLQSHLDALLAVLGTLEATLTYNDFYWTNLAVGRDSASALMFDYNLMGRGYRYSDIRNVCSELSVRACEVFVESYGAFDRQEVAVDECLAHVVNLISACAHLALPRWAGDSLRIAEDGTLLARAQRLLSGV